MTELCWTPKSLTNTIDGNTPLSPSLCLKIAAVSERQRALVRAGIAGAFQLCAIVTLQNRGLVESLQPQTARGTGK